MRTALAFLAALALPLAGVSAEPDAALSDTTNSVPKHEPGIPLFESVEIVRDYLENDAEHDFSDLNLIGIRLHWFESHPRPGEAWIYSFTDKIPTLGDGVSIYHFTDGEIIEFPHGP